MFGMSLFLSLLVILRASVVIHSCYKPSKRMLWTASFLTVSHFLVWQLKAPQELSWWPKGFWASFGNLAGVVLLAFKVNINVRLCLWVYVVTALYFRVLLQSVVSACFTEINCGNRRNIPHMVWYKYRVDRCTLTQTHGNIYLSVHLDTIVQHSLDRYELILLASNFNLMCCLPCFNTPWNRVHHLSWPCSYSKRCTPGTRYWDNARRWNAATTR